MVLTEEEVIQVAQESIPDLSDLQKRSSLLKMHVFGSNYVDYLTHKAELETEAQIKLRKKHSISNRGLWSTILRPVDKVFTANGGSVNIYGQSGDDESISDSVGSFISSNRESISLMQFAKDSWKSLIITEPDSFVLIDSIIDKNGEVVGFTYTPISTTNITNFKRRGIAGYEYVVYANSNVVEIHNQSAKFNQKFVVVDDFANYEVYKNGDKFKIAPFDEPVVVNGVSYESVVHGFDRCPAVANSNIIFDDYKNRKSPIWDEIELSGRYLEENSTLTGFKFLHGYPYFWLYQLDLCPDCFGSGNDANGKCKTCHGTGKVKKDVANHISVRQPETVDEPVIAPNIGGYISPPVDAWKQMNEDLLNLREDISFSHWGTVLAPIKNRTATGQVIDAQPIIQRLSEYTNSAEVFINHLANLIGGRVAGLSFSEAAIRLGNLYLLQSPEQLLESYLKLKDAANDILKTSTLLDYWQHVYEKSPALIERKKKELAVEPYPHNSVSEVQNMLIAQEVKARKSYFYEWNSQQLDSFYLTSDIQKLTKSLDDYIASNYGDATITTGNNAGS